MDGLDAEAYDRNYSDRQLIARIIGYFRPKLRVMLIIAALIVLTSLLDTVLPILISYGINLVVASPTGQVILLLIGAILLSGVFSWVSNFFRQWLTAQAVGDVVLNLRKDAFNAVVARDMSFYDEFPSGKIVSRVTSDTEEFATVVTLTLNLVSQVLLFGLIAVVLLLRHGSNELDSLSTKQPKPGSAATQPRTQANRPSRQGDSPRRPANQGWLGSSHCA